MGDTAMGIKTGVLARLNLGVTMVGLEHSEKKKSEKKKSRGVALLMDTQRHQESALKKPQAAPYRIVPKLASLRAKRLSQKDTIGR